MGCDYYEKTFLRIQLKDTMQENIIIELYCERGYFKEWSGQVDSDDSDYDDTIREYYHSQLEVDFSPIIIFMNGKYMKESYKQKYDKKLSEMVEDFNKIYKITKEKQRYMRT